MYYEKYGNYENFTSTATRKLEELENDFISLSTKNTPNRRDFSVLVIEHLKNRVLALEEMLTGKDALINFFLKLKFNVARKIFHQKRSRMLI